MHSKLRYSLAAGLLAAALTPLSAQSVTTTPVGAVSMEALANSDTPYVPTLVRPAAYEGSIAGGGGGEYALASAAFQVGALEYSEGEQSNTYYLQILSGQAAGHHSTVISNTENSVTLEFESDILSMIQVGDRVVIRPYWTLATLFPPAEAGVSYFASTSNLSSGRKTEVIFPDVSGVGINKSATAIYYYNQFWRRVGSSTINRGDVIVPLDAYVVIRHNNVAENSRITCVGEVDLGQFFIPLGAVSGGRNDNLVAYNRPVDSTLGQLGLESVFTPSTSNLSSGRGDELLVFDPSIPIKNRPVSAIYYYNQFWRKVGQSSQDQADAVIPAGSALVIRKQSVVAGSVQDWGVPVVGNN